MRTQPTLSVGIGLVIAGAVTWMMAANSACDNETTKELCEVAQTHSEQFSAALVLVGIALCVGVLFANRDAARD